MIERNITLSEFLERVGEVKAAALEDLSMFDKADSTVLGVRLRCRDESDEKYCEGYKLFVRFDRLLEYISTDRYAEDYGYCEYDFKSFPTDKFYWEIRKYAQSDGEMETMYTCFFSTAGELLSLGAGQDCYLNKDRSFSAALQLLYDNSEQLIMPRNVELPYMPGDILHIDAAPFGKPFYAVYCAETTLGEDCFETSWLTTGIYERNHPCLYISEKRHGLDLTLLAVPNFPDHVSFAYAPLDRITVVTSCNDLLLNKASRMLKENPGIFRKWFEVYEAKSLFREAWTQL